MCCKLRENHGKSEFEHVLVLGIEWNYALVGKAKLLTGSPETNISLAIV